MKSSFKLEYEVADKHKYVVLAGRNVIERVEEYLPNNVRPLLAVVGRGIQESNPWIVDSLSKIFEHVDIIDDGEESKDLRTALHIVNKLWRLGGDRWSALGVAAGGSLGDTAAFAASIYMRGIPLIQFPTTLLAMIDSSIGGKTAVNFEGVKNILGSFYHPWLTVSDLRFIETLPERIFKSSLAEALKYGFTLDKEYLDFLMSNRAKVLGRDDDVLSKLILEAVRIKLDVVSQDPRERRGVREVLNFGHTVGHVIESISNYSIYHGEAVAIGMIVEGILSEELGCKGCSDEIKRAISDYSIITKEVVSSIPSIDYEQYRNLIYKDKKRVGDVIRWPMVEEIGKWKLVELPVNEFAKKTFIYLRELLEELNS